MEEWDAKKEALEARKKVLDLIYRAQVSHIGSNFSCIDIMSVLFGKMDLDKDVFCLSKGWVAASLYYFLWRKGRITLEELDSYCQPDSKFIGLAEPIIPEIMIAGGSMGLGFPGAVGLALAKKLKGEEGTVYVLMSDGEMQIGTTHESALIAAQHGLSNLVVLVDQNSLQAMGKTDEILKIENLAKLWEAWDWHAVTLAGHDHESLAIEIAEGGLASPEVIICKTTKGKGVPEWENNNLWHYAQIKKDDYEYALSCLN